MVHGRLVAELHWEHGKKNGTDKQWYPDGRKLRQGHWIRDKLHGLLVVWSPEGRVSVQYEMNHGVILREWIDPGVITDL